MAHLDWERSCWQDGYQFVAGVDEAGRGALAGPVCAAAVVLPCDAELPDVALLINDSKQLSERKRTEMAEIVRDIALCWGVAYVDAHVIDEIGISRANRLAMEMAVALLTFQPDIVLLDALTCDIGAPQIGLIDGDAISLSIAAASILAKTERDLLMRNHHRIDHRYHFDRHVGYGTTLHLAALREHGPSAMHRKTFRGVLSGPGE